MRRIKQAGLQRTGTNATKALIEANCPDVKVLTTTLGSKHYLPRESALAQDDLAWVINIKDPISWTVAYWRYKAWQASEETPPRVYDELPFQLPEWLQVWDQRHRAWLTLADQAPDRVVVVQHEALLRDPGAQLTRIADHLDLPRKPGRPRLFTKGYARRGAETDHGADLIDTRVPFDRERHLNGRWAEGIKPDALHQARTWFGWWLTEHPRWGRQHFDLAHLDHLEDYL